MINNSIINDYVEDYILNSGQFIDEFDVDAIVENLHHVALVNDMTIEEYDDCDSFPSDDFIEAFEEAWVIMKSRGRFDVADMKTDRIWRFRWVYRNDVGGYAPHYNFYVWNGVSGCWTSVYSSFDLNEGVAYVEHMDKSELNTYLAYPMF